MIKSGTEGEAPMRWPRATPSTNNDNDDIDDAATLAAFWDEVGTRLHYHYPELEQDEIQRRVSQLLLITHDAAIAQVGSHQVDRGDDAAVMRSIRAACAELFASG